MTEAKFVSAKAPVMCFPAFSAFYSWVSCSKPMYEAVADHPSFVLDDTRKIHIRPLFSLSAPSFSESFEFFIFGPKDS